MLDKLDLQLFAEEVQDNDGEDEAQASAEDEKTENTGQQEQTESNEEKTIPYWRFKEVVEEKNELQKQVNELQDKIENMDDPEQIKEEYEEMTENLQQQNKQFLKKSELKVAALKAGVRDEAIDDFIQVVDLDELEVNDDNEVEGTAELVEQKKEEKPFYFGSEDESGSSKTAGDFNTSNEGGEETKEQWLDKMMNLSQKY